MIRLTLPEPPSANRFYRTFRNRVVMSSEGREYKEAVGVILSAQHLKPLDGALAVTLRWFRGRKSGDLDNRLKIALDSLQGLCYHNDSQIVEIHAYRADDAKRPRLEVQILILSAQMQLGP